MFPLKIIKLPESFTEALSTASKSIGKVTRLPKDFRESISSGLESKSAALEAPFRTDLFHDLEPKTPKKTQSHGSHHTSEPGSSHILVLWL